MTITAVVVSFATARVHLRALREILSHTVVNCRPMGRADLFVAHLQQRDLRPLHQYLHPARPTPDTTVLEIQCRLNELGYNAGTPDGLFGNKTRSAIKAFQRDQRIAATGNADQALLTRLRQATKRSKIGMTESVETSPQSLPSTPEIQLPRTLSGGGNPVFLPPPVWSNQQLKIPVTMDIVLKTLLSSTAV